MAFRPTQNLIEGILDNTTPGIVKGWIDFYRQGKEPLHCKLTLDGDFHDDIRGRVLRFWNDNPSDAGFDGSLGRIEPTYIESMKPEQNGIAGDITSEHRGTVYIEWYSDVNGRVVLNIDRNQTEILGEKVDLAKLPPRTSHPDAFDSFLRKMSVAFRKSSKNPNVIVLKADENGISLGDESERN
jgi:hypothetical protein